MTHATCFVELTQNDIIEAIVSGGKVKFRSSCRCGPFCPSTTIVGTKQNLTLLPFAHSRLNPVMKFLCM